jgi:perosamine synthetase
MAENTTRYPIAKPSIGANEIAQVTDVLKSGILSLGPVTKEFERRFAEYVGTKYAVAISSGTTGLHLCMRWLGLEQGDEVITSPFSFISSSNCILYERAVPRFVDIDRDTLNFDVAKIEAAITPRTKAILAVDIFGYPVDMQAIEKVAARHHLKIVEDACESLGAEVDGKRVGARGYPSVFAFYPNKQMTTGEGGMICTNDSQAYELFKSLSNQGRSRTNSWLQHDELGYNYRLSDIHSAIGIAQLERIDEFLATRTKIAQRYHELLSDIEELELMNKDLPYKRSWFIYPFWAREGLSRDLLAQRLETAGVATRIYLPSIHLQPFYRQRFGYHEGMFPVCESRSTTGLAIPFYVGLTETDLTTISKRIHDAVASVLKEHKTYV